VSRVWEFPAFALSPVPSFGRLRWVPSVPSDVRFASGQPRSRSGTLRSGMSGPKAKTARFPPQSAFLAGLLHKGHERNLDASICRRHSVQKWLVSRGRKGSRTPPSRVGLRRPPKDGIFGSNRRVGRTRNKSHRRSHRPDCARDCANFVLSRLRKRASRRTIRRTPASERAAPSFETLAAARAPQDEIQPNFRRVAFELNHSRSSWPNLTRP